MGVCVSAQVRIVCVCWFVEGGLCFVCQMILVDRGWPRRGVFPSLGLLLSMVGTVSVSDNAIPLELDAFPFQHAQILLSEPAVLPACPATQSRFVDSI